VRGREGAGKVVLAARHLPCRFHGLPLTPASRGSSRQSRCGSPSRVRNRPIHQPSTKLDSALSDRLKQGDTGGQPVIVRAQPGELARLTSQLQQRGHAISKTHGLISAVTVSMAPAEIDALSRLPRFDRSQSMRSFTRIRPPRPSFRCA
jgi:hypothetical protein